MAANATGRDLGLVPNITFTFVEQFIKSKCKASGEQPMNKGVKYFSEGYIHSIKGKFVLISSTPTCFSA